MQAFTYFSKHALKRVAQRTKLPCEEIARILDQRLTINTGQMPGFNRNHLVFYSIIDDNYFVAIQDALTGTVVTILPLDYHARLAWQISNEDCIKAKEILLSAPEKTLPLQATIPPTLFIVSSHFLDNEGNQKTKIILKINSEPYDNDINVFLSEQTLLSRLEGLAEAKGIEPKQLFGISIRLGNKGAPITFDINQISSARIVTEHEFDL